MPKTLNDSMSSDLVLDSIQKLKFTTQKFLFAWKKENSNQ